jgi:RHS repeat-associated protein
LDGHHYCFRDHLGNLRLTYRDSLGTPVGGVYKPPVLVQANDYDPWGVVLDQISFANNQNKINNFDYSNRERQTEFGLNVMALGARMYDPLLGRFWSVDPVTENQENYSPYQYGWNNPVLRNDPNGDCPVCFFVLVGLLLASEPAMAPSGGKNQQREIAAYKQAYNDMGSDVVGSIMPGGRAKTVSQALYATVKKEVKEEIKEQAQKATEKASGGKVPNPNGAKGKSDHQEKVGELAEKARTENPGKDIVTEKKISAEGSNRRPDVQVVNPTTKKTEKVYEAERRPESKRNRQREEEYKRLDIPYETHKVGGN